MSDTITFSPGRGIEAMKAASEASSGGGDFRKIHYFQIAKPGDKVVLRFITPIAQMPVVKFHNFVPTKPGPQGATNWPKSMSAVCRYDEAFRGGFSDCYICDNKITNAQGRPCKATSKTTALACLRMEYKDPETGATGWTDVPRDVKVKEGEATVDKKERSLIVVSMAPSNFWDNVMGYGQRYGTLSDRDYEIERQGEGIKTNYIFFPMDKDPILHPDAGSDIWVYDQAAKTQGLDVDQIIVNQAKDEYYARFFDPRYTVNDQGIVVPVGNGAATGTPAAAAAQESTAEKIRRLQEQVQQGQGRAEAAATGMLGGTPAVASGGDPWASGNGGF